MKYRYNSVMSRITLALAQTCDGHKFSIKIERPFLPKTHLDSHIRAFAFITSRMFDQIPVSAADLWRRIQEHETMQQKQLDKWQASLLVISELYSTRDRLRTQYIYSVFESFEDNAAWE